MSLSELPKICCIFIFSVLLSACGGGGTTDNTSSSTAPLAQISSGSEFVEGTTFIDMNAGNSTDSNGTVESYLWAIENNGGISGLAISDSTSNTIQITGIPAVITADISITISLIVTDNDGESSAKVSKTLVIKNNSSTVVISDVNGIWYSPCFNNSLGFSVRQTLNINGSSMTSAITSYTASTTPTPDCVLPDLGMQTFSDVSATLNYRNNVSNSGCLDGRGVDTEVNISSVSSSGSTYTSSSGIESALAGYSDILPDNTTLCRTSNGNLLFAGYEYTPGPNTSSIDVIANNVDTQVSWQVGNAVYSGGVNGSSSSINNDPNNAFGVLVVATNQDSANGDFSGSNINITHSLSGSGLYTITDIPIANAIKKISFNVTVGIGTTRSTTYVAKANSTNNKVEVIQDSNGKYHFTVGSVIILQKGIEVNGGVAGAPDTIDFTMNNIYDYSD